MPTILVAENDAIIRLGWIMALSRCGYVTLDAGDKAEALCIASGHDGAIQVLLSDVNLPQLDGHALGRELRQTRPEMQVMIVSSYGESEFSPNLHHDALLEKPVDPEVVAAAVKELLLADKVPETSAGREWLRHDLN